VYCKLPHESAYNRIERFELHLYGVKQESPLQRVPVKQSDSDRKPVDYEPLECHLKPMQPNKMTKMRLHFANTTINNNRKQNKPNPDQRYFLLIVEIQMRTCDNRVYTMCACASERVIVRVRKFS
jgi:hypothetical protein